MKSKYQDKHTLWHDKQCVNGEPSSNNAYIYSAYSKYLAPDSIRSESLSSVFGQCIKTINPMRITRQPRPGSVVPLSKDEVIGMVSLGLISNELLEKSHYNFCSLDEDFNRKLTLKSAFKAIKALWKFRKEHRNYVWENNVADAYPLAFWLDPADQYYVRKMAGEKAGILRTVLFHISFAAEMLGKNKSMKMIRWLQCKDLSKKFLLKFVDEKKIVKNYFGEEHPFYRRSW